MLTKGQQCDLTAKMVNSSFSCLRKIVMNNSREVTAVTLSLGCCLSPSLELACGRYIYPSELRRAGTHSLGQLAQAGHSHVAKFFNFQEKVCCMQDFY